MRCWREPDRAGRRLMLALVGIAASACLLHAQLADALVMRGDALLYRGHAAAALERYARAAWIDPDDGVAVDRFVFTAMSAHRPQTMHEAARLATAYLARHRGDRIVLMDRAMTYRALGEIHGALSDFAELGRCCSDPRALTFAGYAALAIGQRARAAGFWRAALVLAPRFPAALHGLARLERRR